MARLHVLAGSTQNTYRCVLHDPVVGTGSNSAGVQWRDALVRSGLGGKSVMTEGANPGQITSAELAQVQAGELLEVVFDVQVDPAWTTTQRNAYLDNEISKASAEAQSRLANLLKWFGATRG